jgi:hypothetical protein
LQGRAGALWRHISHEAPEATINTIFIDALEAFLAVLDQRTVVDMAPSKPPLRCDKPSRNPRRHKERRTPEGPALLGRLIAECGESRSWWS